MAIIFIIIISFLISSAWLHYFKKIDLFEQEKLSHVVITFILGTLFPLIIFPTYWFVFEPLGISESSNPVLNFLFFVFGVGMLEEVVKFIPVLIIIYVFKKAVNEPLDYVKYICISALGFAFGENIEYAVGYGGHVLLVRSILAVPGHMFFSAIFIYGLIEHKYHNKGQGTILFYILMASLAHGIYDFILELNIPILGGLIHMLFFMILISVFVTILNNCLNTSPFYSPKLVIDQELVRKYLIRFYLAICLTILVFTAVVEGTRVAIGTYLWLMFWQSFILIVLITRLSRFSIIPNQKNKVRIKLPFHFKRDPSRNQMSFFGGFTIRGESYNDAKISRLYNEEIKIIPLSAKKSFLNKIHDGIIEKKLSENGVIYFLVRVYLDPRKLIYQHFVLIPKTDGLTHNADGHPIAGLNTINKDHGTRLDFHEWVILKKKQNDAGLS